MIAEKNVNEIEVFINDINSIIKAEHLQKKLEKAFPKLKISFDLNETGLPYPCGHTVLRVEGNDRYCDKIKSTIIKSGFKCDVMEDRVCQ